MNRRHDVPSGGAADKKRFQRTMRNYLSPAGMAAVIAFLQPAACYRPVNEDARQALGEVQWLADTLAEILGTQEYNHLINELGL